MTRLYRPVLIESVEQAEALPVGTTVTHPDYWPREKGNLLGFWEGPGDAMQNAEMVGWTALVPVEAEEETQGGVQPVPAHPGPLRHHLGGDMTTAQRRAIAVALLAVAAITAAAAVTATTWTALVLGMIPAGIAATLAVALLIHRKDPTR